MNKITKHLTANQSDLAIQNKDNSTETLGFVQEGEWMGVLQESEDSYLVMTTKLVGLVKKSACKALTGFGLKIKMDPTEGYSYRTA